MCEYLKLKTEIWNLYVKRLKIWKLKCLNIKTWKLKCLNDVQNILLYAIQNICYLYNTSHIFASSLPHYYGNPHCIGQCNCGGYGHWDSHDVAQHPCMYKIVLTIHCIYHIHLKPHPPTIFVHVMLRTFNTLSIQSNCKLIMNAI